MATLAALFRRFPAGCVPAESAPQASWEEAEDIFRMRPFPFEDVYWHSKKIDNSRVVRQPDARTRRKCWQAIAVSTLAALLMIFFSLPNALGTIAGYHVQGLEQERASLLRETEALEVEEAALLSPQRLEELAVEMQLRDPAPGQVLVLNPPANGALALNVPAK
jgi:cell division protein FtsL